MTTTTTAVDHGITIEQTEQSHGPAFRASCLCGYASALLGDRERARAAGRWHVEAVATSSTATPERHLLTPAEAGDATGLSTDTLKVLRALHVGPHFFQLGSQVVYRRSEIQEWVSDRGCHELDAQIGASNLQRALAELSELAGTS